MPDTEQTLCWDIAGLERMPLRTFCSQCGRNQDTLVGEGNPCNGGRRKPPSVHGCLRGVWYRRPQVIPAYLTDPGETVRMLEAIQENRERCRWIDLYDRTDDLPVATAEAYKAMLLAKQEEKV